MKRILVVAWLAGASALCLAQAGTPLSSVVSAEAAAQALARGAVMVDVRPQADYQAGHVPGAISVPAEAAQAGERAQLQQLVSSQGIDLSREVVIVGHAGDAQAQRLQALLAGYATGRVAWLVGGLHEWTLTGRPVSTVAARLPPLPQYLVPLQPGAQGALRMAGASVRDVAPATTLAQAHAGEGPGL
ncbi:rhodanese-like domain-containing protein [Variovorax terrae]|uniref:Rhodanese-like domain-containing protein n=1 Tax=Variovorax terrae TaxID=2923278 RepID=A0A9X1VVX6_9BURK|nr:rhodanese-like domain-containing protein [Variovorax terrae]MCJ0764741.1 rhodanese-like domain-containing protein [Variovorax terrae]